MDIDYTVVRSRRRTVAIGVDRDLRVTVRGPKNLTDRQAAKMVEEHRDWILKHLERLGPKAEARAAFSFAPGQRVGLLGQQYPIGLLPVGDRPRVEGGMLYLPIDREKREEALMAFYRETLERLLPERLAFWGPKNGKAPQGWRITSARSRWGSCSSRGRLCFSLRLAMVSPELIDYVVVHELAHLVHHNHGPAFYRHAETVMPDFRRRQAALRSFQAPY